jgi:uncharacterized protein YacL
MENHLSSRRRPCVLPAVRNGRASMLSMEEFELEYNCNRRIRESKL